MSAKITVVTPSYNQVRYLEATIQSVLSQRQNIYEYFILDGDSSDGSKEIIQRYGNYIDWWVSEKDDGQSHAIDRGFKHATGDILCWLNSDDLFLPDALARIQAVFDANPAIDIVVGYLVLIDAKDRVISLPRVSSGNNFLGKFGLVQVSQPATFFRRELYERVGGLDLSLHFAMDLDLWARFYKAGAVWFNVPLHLAAFRKHEDAKGSSNCWCQQYQDEEALVRDRYPEIFRNKFFTQGLLYLYRINQILSGRKFISVWEKYKFQGKHVTDVFC